MTTDKPQTHVDAFLRRNEYAYDEGASKWRIEFHGKTYDYNGDRLAFCPLALTLYIYVKDGNIELTDGRVSAEATNYGSGQSLEQAQQNVKWLRAVEKRLANYDKQFGYASSPGEKVARILNAAQVDECKFYVTDQSVRDTFRFQNNYMRKDENNHLYEPVYEIGRIREILDGLDWRFKRAQVEREEADARADKALTA